MLSLDRNQEKEQCHFRVIFGKVAQIGKIEEQFNKSLQLVLICPSVVYAFTMLGIHNMEFDSF